jgi:DNA modification methylase
VNTCSSQLPDFGCDIGIRRRWFVESSFAHPAKCHLGMLQWLIDTYTHPGDTIADPLAGTGSILLAATLQRHVIAREIEPHWLALLEENAKRITRLAGLFAGEIDLGQADARDPWGYAADCVLFSPPYGNETSTSPSARRMLPYRLHTIAMPVDPRWQRLARHPSPGAMGAVSFHYGTHPQQIGHFRGERYWQAMRRVYTQAYRALRHEGSLILIVKDHISKGRRVPTVATTRTVCEDLGFRFMAHHQRQLSQLSLWQRRRKERGEPVIEEEDILVFRKGAQP